MLTLNNNKALKLCLPCLFPLSVQCIGHNSEMCLLKQLCASSHGSRGRKIKGPGYLVAVDQYKSVMFDARWYWVSIGRYWLVLGGTGSVEGGTWSV